MHDVSGSEWGRVRDLLRARVQEIGNPTQEQLAVLAQVTTEALRPLLQGRPNTKRFEFMTDRGHRTRAAVSQAVGWTTDSIDRILIGQDPILAPEEALLDRPGFRDALSRLEDETAAIRRMLQDVLDRLPSHPDEN
jgi:hypothetical protein